MPGPLLEFHCFSLCEDGIEKSVSLDHHLSLQGLPKL